MVTKNIEIKVLEKEITPIIGVVEKMKIETPKEMEKAAEVLSQVNKYADRVKEKKEEITKPLNVALKAARGLFSPLEDKLESAIEKIRGAMSTYQTEKVRLAKEEEDKIAARVGEGKGKFTVETAVKKIEGVDRPETKIEAESGTVKFKTLIKVKITPISEMNEEQLLSLQNQILTYGQEGLIIWDEQAVTTIIKEKKSNDLLPGVTFEEVQIPINSR